MNNHNFDVDIQLPSSNQKVKINKDFIEVNNKKILCNNIEAIKYGVSLVGSKKNPSRKNYSIEIKDTDGTHITISFNSNKVQEVLEEDHTYYYIMSGLWQYAKKQLVNKLVETLNQNQTFKVAEVEVSNQGFTMPYKAWFWGKTKIGTVTWANSSYYLEKGVLHIKSVNDGKINAKLSIHNDWNAVVLNTLLHYLWQDSRKEKLAKGQKI
jgi:hypothetical protein